MKNKIKKIKAWALIIPNGQIAVDENYPYLSTWNIFRTKRDASSSQTTEKIVPITITYYV
jgi:hypothetical protein